LLSLPFHAHPPSPTTALAAATRPPPRYRLPLFEISDATNNPIPNPITKPIVTRLINSPKINPIMIATTIATSLRFFINKFRKPSFDSTQ
jgi:hypothetical protein